MLLLKQENDCLQNKNIRHSKALKKIFIKINKLNNLVLIKMTNFKLSIN